MTVRVAEARAAAARWAAERAGATPGFAGAFLSGSALWLPGHAELPTTSDVDVLVVTRAEPAPPKPGKFRYGGVLLEVSHLSWPTFPTPAAALTQYHLASALSRRAVLADPGGRLTALADAVAREFAAPAWVRRRCAAVARGIDANLAALDEPRPEWPDLPGPVPGLPGPELVTAWLFPTGVTTHLLLAAGLRNPTVRLRYVAARALLADHGLSGEYEPLLELLGCAALSPGRVAGHLRTLAEVFDATAELPRTPFSAGLPFAADLTAAARPVAVDGSAELVAGGLHREAVFWIVATFARCLTLLARDAPGLATAQAPAFAALLADLGIRSTADLRARAGASRAALPRLRRLAATVADAATAPGREPAAAVGSRAARGEQPEVSARGGAAPHAPPA